MSVSISIKGAVKKYGENTIINNLDLNIRDGEFFTLLGPSGCGKTTLLRMIAGFNSIEGGNFYFNDSLINNLDPSKRNIGMVFQNYAIFPHLTVRKNVEFGLHNNSNLDKEAIHKKATDFLKLLQIDQYENRMPENLSGGQQQRVAIARALCIEPNVLLMDEPLSNLDAKLRVEMRAVIRDMQKTIGITTLYVTHDQEEAMAVSDRIAVMDNGIIQQISTPKSIYQRPINKFVASFIGRSNTIEGNLNIVDGKPILVMEGYEVELHNVQDKFKQQQSVVVSIRPEEFLMQNSNEKDGIKTTVKDCIFLGINTHYTLLTESGIEIESIQESTIDQTIKVGSVVYLGLNTDKINVFNIDGSLNILKGVQNDDNF